MIGDQMSKSKEEEMDKAGVKVGKNLFGKPPKPRGVGISQGPGKQGGYGMNKAIDEEIEEISENMEKSTMDPVAEIKKAILEMGPEGLKKALPEMDEANQELLTEILEEMRIEKSHNLPIDPLKKPEGAKEIVELDKKDEAIVDAAKAEGDNEHMHQGGAHDMKPEGWEGTVIKSLALDSTDDEEEVLDALGCIFKAWKMKKDMKKPMKKDMMAKECDMDMEKADDDKMMMEKPKKDPALPGLGGRHDGRTTKEKRYDGKEDEESSRGFNHGKSQENG